jgi:AmmeMemoRadiSam system protein B
LRRPPAVAGRFYPGNRLGLESDLREYLSHKGKKETVLAAICPHAGYLFSGPVAGAVYSSIEIPDDVVLLGPNHTGMGPDTSLFPEGDWEVPNGFLKVNAELGAAIQKNIPLMEKDETAHMYEHSLEVQLPFISYLNPNARIVPVVIGRVPLDGLKEAGLGLARTIKSYARKVLIITSSDMSHYEPDASARKKDALAIDRMTALDPEGLYKTARFERITMCGLLPAVMMLYALRELGAKEGRLVKYMTSAETSGDYGQVVGYAGVVFV